MPASKEERSALHSTEREKRSKFNIQKPMTTISRFDMRCDMKKQVSMAVLFVAASIVVCGLPAIMLNLEY
jgi:hypothetical protein